MKLTERKIEKVATDHGRKDRLVFDDAQRGLAVRVTATGGRTYLCQYTIHGHKWRVPVIRPPSARPLRQPSGCVFTSSAVARATSLS